MDPSLSGGDDGEQASLRAQAGALARQGRLLEAERLYGELLRHAPDDLDALVFLTVRAHAARRLDEALALIDRARVAHPDDAATWVNQGILLREAERLDEAQAFLQRGLELSPQLFVARLRLGEVLQALGRHAEAVPAYYGAVMTAQDQGRWLNDQSTPTDLKPLVLHAMRMIDQGRHRLYNQMLAPLRDQHGAAAMARVDKALATYLGELVPNYADPRQRPTFLFMPDLPTSAWFDRVLFPWYEELEAQTDAIREEMLAVYGQQGQFEPFLGKAGHIKDQLTNESDAAVWDAFFFYRHGQARPANAMRCPRTQAALDRTPLCRIREHAPEVCFSVLTAGSHILPHRGVTNTRIVTHLPLVVPDGDLALHVLGDPPRGWEVGRCFSFDDTFEHEAWNRSGETRVVMLLDVWNPHLTEVEREALTVLVAGIGDFNRTAGL